MSTLISSIRNKYEVLFGEPMSIEQIDRIELIADTLQVRENDAIWHYFLACELYQKTMEKTAENFSQYSDDAKKCFQHDLKMMGDEIRLELIKKISHAAGQVARDVAGRSKWIWATVCITLALAGTYALAGYMHKIGFSAGQESGYQKSRIESDAASWANTDPGKSAYHLYQSGALQTLLTCSNPGWEVAVRDRVRICVPRAAADKSIYGWKLP